MAVGQFKQGIAAGRLSPAEYAENFDDLHPPLDHHEALVESDRCYFCYDAPCMPAASAIWSIVAPRKPRVENTSSAASSTAL